MSKESYIRGFCKAAEAAGVDPKALAKCAQDILPGVYGPRKDYAAGYSYYDDNNPLAYESAIGAFQKAIGTPVATSKTMRLFGDAQAAIDTIAPYVWSRFLKNKSNASLPKKPYWAENLARELNSRALAAQKK